jgi:hypothetical protein
MLRVITTLVSSRHLPCDILVERTPASLVGPGPCRRDRVPVVIATAAVAEQLRLIWKPTSEAMTPTPRESPVAPLPSAIRNNFNRCTSIYYLAFRCIYLRVSFITVFHWRKSPSIRFPVAFTQSPNLPRECIIKQ